MTGEKIYDALPNSRESIRLLSVMPGWPSDPIQVALVVIPQRANAPQYHALSYVWGENLDPTPIMCNGVPKQITVNLADALRALRPLPTDGDPKDHGVSVMDQDHILHSSRNVWGRFAFHRDELDLAGRSEPLLLWVDSLCINQMDVSERSSQVQIMTEIYASAELVRIWLGKEPSCVAPEASNSVQKFFNRVHLSDLGEMPIVLSFIAQALKNVDNGIVDSGTSGSGFPHLNQPEWLALKRFFELPWFQRVWTVQEAVVGKAGAVTIGCWEINWDLLALAAIWFTQSNWSTAMGEYYGPNVGEILGLEKRWRGNWPGIPAYRAAYMATHRAYLKERKSNLYGLLKGSRERKATLPQDYVFSLLSLAREFSGPMSPKALQIYDTLKPDYTKTAAEVFTNAANFGIQYLHSLAFLSELEISDTTLIPGLPSWAPNWSVPRKSFPLTDQVLLGRTGFLPEERYETSQSTVEGEEETEYFVDNALKQLTVAGFYIDRVSSTTAPLESEFSWTSPIVRFNPVPQELEFVSAAWKLAKRLVSPASDQSSTAVISNLQSPTAHHAANYIETRCYNSESEILETLCDALIAGENSWEGSFSGARPWLWHHLGDTIYKASSVDKAKRWLSSSKPYFTDDPRHMFQNALTTNCTWRRFFITAKGYMGVGPLSMQEGDEVVILFGLYPTLVIRPQIDSGQRRYLVVGECYVSKISREQVFRSWKASNEEKEMFHFV